jgi:Sap, sulfolipid-1-addressing protein
VTSQTVRVAEQRVGRVFAFSVTAALNPSLLAAVTIMLTLEKPKRLLVGYLMGAVVTSVTCGMLIVFSLHGSNTSNTAKRTVNPAINIALGLLILLLVFVVGTGRDRRRRAWTERRHEKAQDRPPPRWRRTLSKGSARDTFVVGALLSFPGASYIAGMDLLSKQKIGTTGTVFAVLAFNVIMLLLLELPLLGYATKPEWTAVTVHRFSDWLSRSGGRVALIGAAVIGVLLIGRGVINF